jgi:hypothetical protein
MKFRYTRPALIIILGLFILAASSIYLINRANAQNDVASDIKMRLAQKGVPVISVDITGRFTFQIEIVIQSTSTNNLASPDDPFFEQAAHREVAFARMRGVKIDIAKVTAVNSAGTPIFWSEIPVDTALDTIPVVPSQAEDTTITATIRDSLPLNGMTLDILNTSRDEEEHQVITIKLSVKDVATANVAIPPFMSALSRELEQLRIIQGTQLGSCTVEIVDADSQPLLKYVKDFQPSAASETWWQAPGMLQSWFPQPMSVPADLPPTVGVGTPIPPDEPPYPPPPTPEHPSPHAYRATITPIFETP